MRVFWTADRILIAILDALIIAIAGLILVLMNYAVFSRFVLNSSVSWGEELPAHLLAMLTFIGGAYLARTNGHLCFDGVLEKLPGPVQRIFLIGIQIMMIFFAGCLTYYGAIAAWSFFGRDLISIELPVSLFRGAMPVGGAIIALICTIRLVGLLIGRLGPDDFQPQHDD